MTEKKNNINEKMKYEIAEELGLSDKVREKGWKSLTAKESGRIGGILRSRKMEKRDWLKSTLLILAL